MNPKFLCKKATILFAALISLLCVKTQYVLADPLKDNLQSAGQPAHITSVAAQGLVSIAPQYIKGDPRITHFATPKGGQDSVINLTAVLTPDTPASRERVSWEGATEDPNNPLKATLPKDAAAKHIVKVKIGTRTEKELRVWVIWGTFDEDQILGGASGFLFSATAYGWKGGPQFFVDIAPHAIFDDENRPLFEKSGQANPPGGTNFCGLDLSGGSEAHWDMSRKMRQKVVKPNNWQDSWWIGPACAYSDVPVYPENPIGNDDSFQYDEIIDPLGTTNHGGLAATSFKYKLFSTDNPTIAVRNVGGNQGNTVDVKTQYVEFARLYINGSWQVISDLQP